MGNGEDFFTDSIIMLFLAVFFNLFPFVVANSKLKMVLYILFIFQKAAMALLKRLKRYISPKQYS